MSESKTIFVKPAPDLKVYDPATKGFLPEEGSEVVAGIYWERRLNDGDITVARSSLKPTVKSTKKDA